MFPNSAERIIVPLSNKERTVTKRARTISQPISQSMITKTVSYPQLRGSQASSPSLPRYLRTNEATQDHHQHTLINFSPSTIHPPASSTSVQLAAQTQILSQRQLPSIFTSHSPSPASLPATHPPISPSHRHKTPHHFKSPNPMTYRVPKLIMHPSLTGTRKMLYIQ